MAESEMDSFQLQVLQRAKEINRLKAGKASETVASPLSLENEQINLHIENGSAAIYSTVGNPQNDHVRVTPERGSVVGGSNTELWEALSNMAEKQKETDEQQVDILSNIVVTLAKIQKDIDRKGENNAETGSVISSAHVMDCDGRDKLDMMVDETESSASGEDDEEDEKEDTTVAKTTSDMPVNEDNLLTEKPSKPCDLNNSDIEENGDSDICDDSGETVRETEAELIESEDKLKVKVADWTDNTMSVGDIDLESDSKSDGEPVGEERDEGVKAEGKENCDDVRPGKELSDSDIELEVRRTLREAVEIRVPKMKSRKDSRDQKWLGSLNVQSKTERPETPPLQKLMRQDFSPLKLTHSPPKKVKESSSMKDGFTSKLASVIVPSTSIPLRTASHPKQLLSHAFASLRSQSGHRASSFVKSTYPASSLLSSSFSPLKPTFHPPCVQDDQPLDLSKKAGKESKDNSNHRNSNGGNGSSSKKSSHHKGDSSGSHDNGISSTSLQSLQQKFGGDYHLRGLRKPTNYMLFGPEIPALQQALLHSASLSLPHFPLSMSNGMPKMKSEHSPSFKHRNSTPSPNHKVKTEDPCKTVKKDPSLVEKSSKREKFDKIDSPEETEPVHEEHNEKYTNHMCTCGKWYDSLYSLSLHLQETGHLPARSKSVSLLEYPKLVRGQDMWLNQESEQTRRILRCIQCGESFKTLPMLTVHMMKTQHYTKIVSSEHARRAHKCSAYCDKEQDKECVFKCKVCHESFSDMEGLANHMIMSGHHKKQVPRPSSQPFDLQFRQKRKRLYSFEDNLNPYNSAMAAMMDYKRKQHQQERASPEEGGESEVDDSLISCENCGRKIETKLFVEHVRACLGQTLAADIKRYKEMKEREVEKRLEQGSKRKRRDSTAEESESKRQRDEANRSTDTGEENLEDAATEGCIKQEHIESEECKSKDVTRKSIDRDEVTEQTVNNEHQEAKEMVESVVKDESPCSEIHSPIQWANIKQEVDDSPPVGKSKKVIETESVSNDTKVTHKGVSKNLDIIDPTAKDDSQSSGSALSAMESFIKKSFSNKFDYKKGNIVIGPQPIADASVIHSRTLPSAMNMDSFDYLNKYKKFYSALNLQNGLKQDGQDSESGKSKYLYDKASKSKKDDDQVRNLDSPNANGTESKDDGRSSVKSYLSDNSSSLDTNENIEKKYLNMTEETEVKVEKGKSSALDNLSSFVYGQPMTSEHPLDSLQRLITKADIPKLMVSHGARAFKYLPPHLQLHAGHTDLISPLNLSLKTVNGRGGGGGGAGENDSEEGEEDEEKLRPDDDSLSDYEAMCSPVNSDGEPVDYRCAACSRRFASKGSYRYHLSRCHLSSVKRYGIKEAFNMSPYVYLPLDHTAKFSKYYEMAKELANKKK